MWRPGELPAVLRRDDVSALVFRRDHVRTARPIVLEGLARRWPALDRWTPQALAEHHGDRRVSAYQVRDGHVVIDPRTGLVIEHMTLRDYVAHATASEPRYYLRASMKALPELGPDVRVPPHCEDGLGLRSNLWFSARGTVTRLHFDLPHNLIVQVFGRKRFILFPPSDRRALYPYSWRSSTPHASRVDAAEPDFARWPRLALARGQVCALEPGDALYIPPRWWHHASSVETSITVNFWWCDPATWVLLAASDLYKRARGLSI